MSCGGAVVLWQFDVVRVQAERLSALDQKPVAVERVHAAVPPLGPEVASQARKRVQKLSLSIRSR